MTSQTDFPFPLFSETLSHSSIYFFGRPFAELMGCFGLSPEQLVGRRVLECPSGPSSFVSEARSRGIDAIGVDPIFYRCPAAVRDLAESDFRRMFDKMRAAPGCFVPGTYDSIDAAESARREGMQRFLADYERGFAAGIYRSGSLPRLDFEDEEFDTVLCGHLFFIYAEQLGEGFHVAATRELCRLASREVRIHPLVGPDGQESGLLRSVMETAQECGFTAAVSPVEHEFFRGTNHTLALQRAT